MRHAYFFSFASSCKTKQEHPSLAKSDFQTYLLVCTKTPSQFSGGGSFSNKEIRSKYILYITLSSSCAANSVNNIFASYGDYWVIHNLYPFTISKQSFLMIQFDYYCFSEPKA